MQVLMTILYVLLFLVFLSVLIIIHELGHLAAAKAFNVYCLEYSIGMGPALFKYKRKNGETQFTLRGIPFGGYVSMYGEGVELPEGVTIDESRSLNGIKPWKRAIILVAGVTMNAVLAFVFLFISNFFPKGLYVNQFNVTESSIAAEAGIKDMAIYEYEAMQFKDEVEKTNYVFYVLDQEATIDTNDSSKYAVCFNFDTLTLKNRDLTDKLCVYGLDAEGKPDFTNIVLPNTFNYVNFNLKIKQANDEKTAVDELTVNLKVNTKEGKYEPFGLALTINQNKTFAQVINGTCADYGRCSVTLFQALGDLFTKPASWGEVGGIVAVGFETTSVLQDYGFGRFLYYWSFISINLAIFNLLPFPGLDGWQLLVLIIEVTARKKIPEKVKNIISFVGIGLLLVLMVVVLGKDLWYYVFRGMFN
ncbi:MAG: site-2 protease family protein [Bacilli bacterium]|nr:site-2 protease family protein [Bacilli bacterium]